MTSTPRPAPRSPLTPRIVAALLALAACQPAPDTAAAGDTPGDTTALTLTATVAANPHNPYSALVTVTADQDATVVIAYGEGAVDRTTPSVALTAGVATTVPVLQLRATHTYDLRVLAAGATGTTTRALTFTPPAVADTPTCTATFFVDESEFSPDEAVCTNLLTPAGHHVYTCLDRWGAPVAQFQSNGDDALMSMTPMPDGSWVSTSNTSSKLIFFDPTGAETAEVIALAYTEQARFDHWFIDNHEALPITTGDLAGGVAYFTLATETFDDGSHRIGSGVEIIDPTTLALRYDYSFHGVLGDQLPMDPLVPYTRAGWGDTTEDWTHGNAILDATDADGRGWLLVSLKAQDWLVKLYPDTDEIAWRWGQGGDFTLVEDIDAAVPVPRPDIDWPFHAHGMQWIPRDDGRRSLLLFDNGYPRRDGDTPREDLLYSRVVIATLDESTRLTQLDWVVGGPDAPDPMFAQICGNAERVPGGGAILVGEGETGQMREIAYPSGELRWQMSCDGVDVCQYRAHLYPSLYETTGRYE